MEQKNFLTDAELTLMRECAQLPQDKILAGDIGALRRLIETTLGNKARLINCKFR